MIIQKMQELLCNKHWFSPIGSVNYDNAKPECISCQYQNKNNGKNEYSKCMVSRSDYYCSTLDWGMHCKNFRHLSKSYIIEKCLDCGKIRYVYALKEGDVINEIK